MADLPTNLKDDILDSSVNTKRKYRMIENEDGTYSFEDATEYSQVGDEYGAGLINETNRQVNARVEKAVVVRDLDTIGAITQPGFIPDALALKDVSDSFGGVSQFIVDEETGKISGYKTEIGGADTVFPFSGELEVVSLGSGTSFDISKYADYDKLTADNFYVVTSASAKSFTLPTGSYETEYTTHYIYGESISKSYNATTGILTVSVTPPRVVINGRRKWNSGGSWQSFSEASSPNYSYTVYIVHNK